MTPQPPDAPSEALEPQWARYARQVRFDAIGIEGQRRLSRAHVVLIGCGALGTVLANTLVRAGVGHLRICDRDYIEKDNLQRQVLFDESDIEAGLPKAQAAVKKLKRINAQVSIEGVVTDVNHTNIETLTDDAELILDGTDNFETRFLINDLCIKTGRPWVYGAVVGATGLCMTIVPGKTPCLRCVFEQAPPPELSPTCDTAGVLGSVVNIIASLQAVEAMKLLMGRVDDINRHLVHVDAWSGRFVNMNVRSSSEPNDCPCCQRRRFPFLSGEQATITTTLCGRNAVQINLGAATTVSFSAMADKLKRAATSAVSYNEFMLRATVDGYELTLFADGRAIIKGTDDPDRARSVYARYLGH